LESTWEKEKQDWNLQKQITETDSVQIKKSYDENLQKVEQQREKVR
jgi:uncharacterized protein